MKEGVRLLHALPKDGNSNDEVSWPGEYDFGGVTIRALGKGETDQVNYIISTEEMRCGFLSSPLFELTEQDTEVIGDLDVLVIPAEDVKAVQLFVDEVDPRVVIPIKMKDEKTYREVVAACGGKDVEEVKEVKLKKGSLPTETREVYVLKA